MQEDVAKQEHEHEQVEQAKEQHYLERARIVYQPLAPETTHALQHVFDAISKTKGGSMANAFIETILQTCDSSLITQETVQTLALSTEEDLIKRLLTPGMLTTYLEDAEDKISIEKQLALQQKKTTNEGSIAGIIKEKDQNNVTITSLESSIETKTKQLSAINTAALNYLRDNPPSLPPTALASINLSIPPEAQAKLQAQGRTPETYKTYVYALHHADSMPPEFRDIVGTQDPQELLTSMNAEYGIKVSMVTEVIPSSTQRSFDAVAYTSTAIVPETGKQRDAHGFDTVFTTFSEAALDKNSALQAPLDAAITTTFTPDRCVDTKATPQVSKPGFESISFAGLQTQTDNFRSISPEMLRDLMHGIVPEDKIGRAHEVFIKYLHERAERNPSTVLSEKQQATEKKLDAMLDAIIKKRFLTETQQVAKVDVAQRYLGQVADVLKVGGQNLVLHGGAQGVTYLRDGGMQINYHTSQAPDRVESMVITAQGEVRMSTRIAPIQGADPTRTAYMMEHGMTTLPGKVLTMRDMAARAATQTERYTAARGLHMKQGAAFDSEKYRTTLLRNPADLQPSPEQQQHAAIINAAMDHALASTKLMDIIAHETQSRLALGGSTGGAGSPDAFVRYYTGNEQFIDKRQHPELTSLFALRTTCVQSGASDIQQCTDTLMQLSHLYPPTLPADRSPFAGPDAASHLYATMDYFTIPTKHIGGGFDVSAFTRFVEAISRESPPPTDINQWLSAKEERLAYIPLQSMKRHDVEKRVQENASRGLEKSLDAAYAK